MFCPGCAIQITDNTKFCKNCGANLQGVREAMTGKGGELDWSKTWVAEMFMTQEERDRRRGVTAEQKRLKVIQGGVITMFAGLGAMIFLKIFLGVVADNEPAKDAEIIRHVWLCGLVPFFVGIGLLINGIFLSGTRRSVQSPSFQPPVYPPMPSSLPTPTTNQLEASRLSAGGNASIVEHTTAHLPAQLSERREAVYASRREDEQ